MVATGAGCAGYKAGFTRYDKLQRSIAATNCTDISLYLGVSTRNDLSSNIFSIHQPAMEGTGEWTAFAMCLVGESSRNKRKSRKKWSRDWLLKKRMHSHTVLLDGNTKARTK